MAMYQLDLIALPNRTQLTVPGRHPHIADSARDAICAQLVAMRG